MANYENRRRSRLVEGLALLSLIVLSAILLLTLNALAWPLTGQSVSSPTATVSSQTGFLRVILNTVTETVTGAGAPTNITAPVPDVAILVYTQGTQSVVDANNTNSAGVYSVDLSPAPYVVRIRDVRFNLTAPLQIIA